MVILGRQHKRMRVDNIGGNVLASKHYEGLRESTRETSYMFKHLAFLMSAMLAYPQQQSESVAMLAGRLLDS